MVALSGDVPAPHYRITRSSLWKEEVNPWTDPQCLPTLQGGLLGRIRRRPAADHR